MDNFRNRPKENFIREANWDELYLLIENWKDDIEFYLFEINFLESIIESHFSELLLYENLDELRELQIEVFELKNQSEYILKCVKNNLDSIVNIINNKFIHDTFQFRIENEHIEDNIQIFITNERELRRTIFRMIKDVYEVEKTKKVWMFN